MAEKASLSFGDYNPDVLTCIANLSSDEVFTPPELANQILDSIELAWSAKFGGESIWKDSTVRFLDPFTKSGVFLREITRRLSAGLASEFPDIQSRLNHITQNQVFGIAVTELTSLMARRSVYCSKDASGLHSISRAFNGDTGNIWYQRLEHTWQGGTVHKLTSDSKGDPIEKFTNGKCAFCGASQTEYDRSESLESHAYALLHTNNPQKLLDRIFGSEMKFDVVVGNPPYQLSDGGHSNSAVPIYNKFVEQAKKLEPTYLSMVIPARWYAGGKGLDSFRADMLNDRSLRTLVDYPDSSTVFPGVSIEGGVCYFLWEKGYQGDCEITNNYNSGETSTVTRPLVEHGADVFIRHNSAISIYRKVWPNGLDVSNSFMGSVSSRKPFGLDTQEMGNDTEGEGDITLFKNGGKAYIAKLRINQGSELIDKWKVLISYAYGIGGKFPSFVIGKPFIAPPGSVCSETYLVVGPFESESEAQSALTFMSTKFFRFLVLLHKPTQHGTKNTYTFVPSLQFEEDWTDELLYSKYGLTGQEIAFIDSMVRPMELGDE